MATTDNSVTVSEFVPWIVDKVKNYKLSAATVTTVVGVGVAYWGSDANFRTHVQAVIANFPWWLQSLGAFGAFVWALHSKPTKDTTVSVPATTPEPSAVVIDTPAP